MNLLLQGCLSSAPTCVSFAVSLRTLELYRHLHVRQPRLSIQAWVRSLCDYHNITYYCGYWEYFSDTFNIYLKILRGVDARVHKALGRTDEHWRAKHSCPCCQHKIPGEVPLEVSLIGVLDGNQSLKRARFHEGLNADPRAFTSDYYISEDIVNRFKHDVKPRHQKKQANRSDIHANGDEALPVAWSKDSQEATPADGDGNNSTCTERWKVAQSDNLKRMWVIYRETGIFLSACRHGFIWWIVDMIESGELAKYPLAIVDRALDVFGDKLGIGYDIRCSFTATVGNSSIAHKAHNKGLRFVVPAFHGYAHKRLCQLSFHPLFVTGFGIEDLETAERIFSSFNGLANTTRHASRFHRLQAVDLFSRQHDDDKYQELSTFLLGNYKQLSQLLGDLPGVIASLESGKSHEDTRYHQHLENERVYLLSRRQESPEEEFACEYIELLIMHQKAKFILSKSHDHAVAYCIANVPPQSAVHGRAEILKQHAFENYQRMQDMLQVFETTHNIKDRWTPDMPEWQTASQYFATREYQKALTCLEGLVVSCLFELQKMGLSGTGYKLRTHINKSLKTHCKAIQRVLKRYNEAAATLGRPLLEWKDISTYDSLAEFELLRECREDICSQPWADAANREATLHTLRLERAKEERYRLNVEIARLVDWMNNEETVLKTVITRLNESDLSLVVELKEMLVRRSRQNTVHRRHIYQIYNLPHYTGPRDPEISSCLWMCSSLSTSEGLNHGDEAADLSAVQDDTPDVEEDDLLNEELDRVNDFLGNLSIVDD
ncbi:hypothetical protein BGW80DRAFT_1194853 [Lactifluus volemus]|nr:hypothetical protein BGW80DRAFT_1194853 [Lactifluus volemus]